MDHKKMTWPTEAQEELQQPTTANPPAKSWMAVQTAVKNQASCGSCWAFATTEVLESHYAISNTGQTPPILAPQTLVSCLKNPQGCGGTGGCEGATPELGFNYTKAKGIALEKDFPYKATDEPCVAYKAAATVSGYVKLKQNSSDALETALANVGPVAIAVSAGQWFSYGGGVFSGGCKMPVYWKKDVCNLDHAVVVVAYTPEYWLVRNSWGAGWGEAGYIRLTRKNDKVTFRDDEPSQGVACKPYPAHEWPAGESGLLYDMSYPTGVKAA